MCTYPSSSHIDLKGKVKTQINRLFPHHQFFWYQPSRVRSADRWLLLILFYVLKNGDRVALKWPHHFTSRYRVQVPIDTCNSFYHPIFCQMLDLLGKVLTLMELACPLPPPTQYYWPLGLPIKVMSQWEWVKWQNVFKIVKYVILLVEHGL